MQSSGQAKFYPHLEVQGSKESGLWSFQSEYEPQDIQAIADAGIIPREDAGVYLTAKQGKAKCFVSRNYKLIRALVEQTEEFECFTPSEFLQKYAP